MPSTPHQSSGMSHAGHARGGTTMEKKRVHGSFLSCVFACVALLALGAGCASEKNAKTRDGEAPAQLEQWATSNCDDIASCTQRCSCEAAFCLSQGGGSRFCDEQKFQCVLACKPGGGGGAID